jgi:hypothetical protein
LSGLVKGLNKIQDVRLAILFRDFICKQEITIANKILEYSLEWIRNIQSLDCIKSGDKSKDSDYKADIHNFLLWILQLETIFRGSTMERAIGEATRINIWNAIDF